MFCKHCGKEIDDNAFVCIHCGSLVKEITTEKPDYEKKTNGMAIAGFVCSFFYTAFRLDFRRNRLIEV